MLWLNQAADMPEEDAGAELAVGLRGIPAVTARLQSYVDKAAKDYEAGLIRKSGPQVRAVGRHPFLEAPFRGQVIDNAVKSAARNDPDLSHLWISRPGEFGPDFHDIDTNTWWDVTTPGQWQAHVDLYIDPFGAGIGLFTK